MEVWNLWIAKPRQQQWQIVLLDRKSERLKGQESCFYQLQALFQWPSTGWSWSSLCCVDVLCCFCGCSLINMTISKVVEGGGGDGGSVGVGDASSCWNFRKLWMSFGVVIKRRNYWSTLPWQIDKTHSLPLGFILIFYKLDSVSNGSNVALL